MKTSTRVIRIEDFNPKCRFQSVSCASYIRLKGRWLKEAGFHYGMQVLVEKIEEGIIELRVFSPLKEDTSYLAALKHLDAALKKEPGIPIDGPRRC
jgi:hypothetical protein